MDGRAFAVAAVVAGLLLSPVTSRAQGEGGAPSGVGPSGVGPSAPVARSDVNVVDWVAVRFVAPETGGAARPRFFTEREVAFFTKIEGLVEQADLDANEYPERFVRAAVDRLVARAILASLMVQRGVEPPDLPRLTLEAREDLTDRVGGAQGLDALMKREGLGEEELLAFLRDRVRATYYVDRAVTPILAVTEDQLREAFRSALHPYRAMKFDDARPKMRRWLVTERLRVAELEFLQSARARIRVTALSRSDGGRARGRHE